MKEKQIDLKKGLLLMAFSVLCILSCFMIAKPKEVEAASSYKEIFTSGDPTTATKVGKYYYKCKFESSNWRLYYSTKKSSGYKKTNIKQCYGMWTNGTNIYYISNESGKDPILYRYNISKKKNTKIKNMKSAKKNEGCTLFIEKFYSGKIYFTVEDEYNWCYRTYYYNKSTKKIKGVKSNCSIIASSGKYCVCQKQYISEYYPVTLTLYKINSSGKFTKIKTLSKKAAPVVKISNKKIYYATYSSNSMKKFSVYRVNIGGSGKKKLTTVSASSMSYVDKISSKAVRYTSFSSSGSKSHRKKF